MQCHRAVPRLSSCGDSDPDRFGAIDCALASAKRDEPLGQGRRLPQFGADFALFVPAGPASDTLTDKKDPLRRKESDKMEPSGFEPLTPCMPCRESRLRRSLFTRVKIL